MNSQAFALAFAGKLDPAAEIEKLFALPELAELEFKVQNALQEPGRA